MQTASYVDPITNATFLSQVDLRAHLAEFIKFKIPERFLPTFLHEATHHSCFMSPVGNTLALLRMRAYRRAAAIRDGRGGDEWDLLEDVLRQEATMEIFRPLAEGLACFSELESVPGNSNTISDPMRSAFFYFGGRKENVTVESLNMHLFSMLLRARMDPELAERKESILASRFDFESGGHLAGLMAVKSLWTDAKRRSKSAWDPELFGAFLRAYFYNDYAVIGIILDPEAIEHNAVNAVAAHVLKRMKQLFTMDIERALGAFEKTNGRQTPRTGSRGIVITELDISALEIDEPAAQIGRDRLFALFQELRAHDLDEAEVKQCERDIQRIVKRELLCLGSLDALIKVNEHDRVLVYDSSRPNPTEHPIFAAAALPGAKRGISDGSLEYYLIPNSNARAIVASRDGEVVFVDFEGPIDEARRAGLMRAMTSRSADTKIIEEQEACLEQVIADSAIQYVRDSLKRTLPSSTLRVYSWIATASVDADRWKGVMEKLAAGGLFALFDNDATFLRGLAFLSVAASVNPSFADLIKAGAEQGVSVPEVLDAAAKYETLYGLPTVARIEDVVAAFV